MFLEHDFFFSLVDVVDESSWDSSDFPYSSSSVSSSMPLKLNILSTMSMTSYVKKPFISSHASMDIFSGFTFSVMVVVVVVGSPYT